MNQEKLIVHTDIILERKECKKLRGDAGPWKSCSAHEFVDRGLVPGEQTPLAHTATERVSRNKGIALCVALGYHRSSPANVKHNVIL